ncbi:MAG TPA: radical SAM protein [Rhizomicrobium sp.]|nr:radical SAM protein [Rhizomicrobium sp.]
MAYERALFDSLRNDKLDLRLLPTEQCNFRCTYCYETFEEKKMRPAVVAGVKALISRRAASLNELHIDWFGGEPTLAADIVADISRHAIAESRRHGFLLTAAITTNGYFLDARGFKECLDNGIGEFQVTFDGGKEIHDASRVLGSGLGTFDRIWANVVAMKDVPGDFTILLRLHYTDRNYREVGAFAARIHDTFGDDPRFRLYFKGIKRLGGPNDKQIGIWSPKDDAHMQRHMWDASGYRAGVLATSESDTKGVSDYVCYASMANSLLVRANGRLGKCTVALYDDFNTIGEIREDGEIVVDQEKFQRWITPVVEGDWPNVGCPLQWVANHAPSRKRKTTAA